MQVLGRDPFENDAVLSRMCFIKEGQRYPDYLRVCDALSAAATLYPAWDADLAEQLVGHFQLSRKRQIKKLSRGMNSAVGLVLGLAPRAPVTLLDEPYLGLDAVSRHVFNDRLLADYVEQPRTIVLSIHLIEEISDLLEPVLLIDHGRGLLYSDADTLRASALTVSGPARRVFGFAAGHELLHTESMAGQSRAVVRAVDPVTRRAATELGLTVEPTSMQQLVVAMSLAAVSTPPSPGSDRRDLSGAPR